MSAPGVRVDALGKAYRSRWALRECTFEIPAGAVCGLVGANGAGKTTLLRILAGLARPTTGAAQLHGATPADRPEFLRQVGYLGQEAPLYRRWTAADHLAMGAHLNPVWDGGAAVDRLRALGIPLDQRVGTLSGGQRAQVALALALGKRPRVLLLDEPVAALDPLARREFLRTLAGAVADGDLTVLLSSHLVTDLERVCDHLVLLAAGRTVLAGSLEDVLASHRLLTGPRVDTTALERDHHVVRREQTARQTTLWVRLDGPLTDPRWHAAPLALEDIVLAYLGAGAAATGAPALAAVGGAR